MARIAGIDLPRGKRIEYALPYLYGIGLSRSREILGEAGVSFDIRTDDLSSEQEAKIRSIIERRFKVEGDLRREMTLSVKRLMDMGSYRGLRHRKNLPARGQRTRTNARTRKGPRRAAVAGKKAAPKK